MKDLHILKLGGSVITEKDKIESTLRSHVLIHAFEAIKQWQTKADADLIIVHGGGGYIHNLAYKYELQTGTGTDPCKLEGMKITHEASRSLNISLVELAIQAGLQAAGYDTSSIIKNKDKKIAEFDTTKVTYDIQLGYIPMLHGDMVQDPTLGYSICSGDEIVAKVAELVPVTKIIFASDIDGIFTADPHSNPNATLLERLRMSELMDSRYQITGSHNIDTTGGLAGKLEACKNLFSVSTTLQKIEIFNGLQPENYQRIFEQQVFPHTTITN